MSVISDAHDAHTAELAKQPPAPFTQAAISQARQPPPQPGQPARNAGYMDQTAEAQPYRFPDGSTLAPSELPPGYQQYGAPPPQTQPQGQGGGQGVFYTMPDGSQVSGADLSAEANAPPGEPPPVPGQPPPPKRNLGSAAGSAFEAFGQGLSGGRR